MGGLIFLAAVATAAAVFAWVAGPFLLRQLRSASSNPQWRDLVPRGIAPPAQSGDITTMLVLGHVADRSGTRLLVAVDRAHILTLYVSARGTQGLLLDRQTAVPIVRSGGGSQLRISMAGGKFVFNESFELREALAENGWPVVDESVASGWSDGGLEETRYVVSAPAAGWYADPTARHESRYWDGAEWTSAVTDGTQKGTDPI